MVVRQIDAFAGHPLLCLEETAGRRQVVIAESHCDSAWPPLWKARG
jgi:hypothetical protein